MSRIESHPHGRRRDPAHDAALEKAALVDRDPMVRARAGAAYRQLWPWRKRPGTAAALAVLPGGGQVYLRNPGAGAAHLVGAVGLLGGAAALLNGESVELEGGASSANVPVALVLAVAAQNLWFYSMFDAYRDARVLRGDAGYQHPITRETLDELLLAPFDPRVLRSPWVWGGVPVALAAGLGFSYLVDRESFREARSITEVDKVNVLGHELDRGPGLWRPSTPGASASAARAARVVSRSRCREHRSIIPRSSCPPRKAAGPSMARWMAMASHPTSRRGCKARRASRSRRRASAVPFRLPPIDTAADEVDQLRAIAKEALRAAGSAMTGVTAAEAKRRALDALTGN
jgi:hypothetical protein